MRKSAWILGLAIIACQMPATAYAADQSSAGAVRPIVFDGREPKRVTMEFKETPVMEAFKQLAKKADVSFAVRGKIPEDLKVTVYLQNADAYTAVRLLCDAAGLSSAISGSGGWVISARPIASISGTQVPILGAIPSEILNEATQRLGGTSVAGILNSLPSATGAWWSLSSRTSFPGDRKLVDLEGKNISFADAMAQLSKASGVPIIVDNAVPAGMKVTAKIHGLPLGDVLAALVSQARLVYSVGEVMKDGKAEIHVSPVPELSVTGAGAIHSHMSGWGSFGGGGSGPPAPAIAIPSEAVGPP